MVKIAMLMPGQSETDEAIERLAAMHIEHLDWRLLTSPEDLRPGGDTAEPGGGVGAPTRERASMMVAGETTVRSLVAAGVPKAAAPFFARRLEGGTPIIIASVPEEREALVRRAIEEAGGRAADEP